MTSPRPAVTGNLIYILGRTIRERDSYRELLSLTLAQLHTATGRNRRLQERMRQMFTRAPLGALDASQRASAEADAPRYQERA